MRSIMLLTLLLFTTPCWADVVITTSKEYYTVDGITKAEISKSLKANATHKIKGQVAAAVTKTDIKYRYTWRQKNGRCAIEKAVIHLHLTYEYPRLARSQDGTIRKWWNELTKKHEIHELIHGEISTRYAHELDKKLNSLDDLNCATVKEVVKTRAQYIIRQMRIKQEEYDRITDHGRKQEKYKGH